MKTRKLLVFSTAALMVASSALAFTACGDSCEHNYRWTVTTPATCEAGGVESGTCDKCGEKTTRETKALGHSWTWTTETSPTESAGGTLSAVCSTDVSHKVESLAIPALGSAYTKVSETDATYTSPKAVTYKYTDAAYGVIQFTAYYGEKLEITDVEDAIDAALEGAEFAGKAENVYTSYKWVTDDDEEAEPRLDEEDAEGGETAGRRVLKPITTTSGYEFGEQYTHIVESVNVEDYVFYVNDEMFIVQRSYEDYNLLSVEYNEGLANGYNYGAFSAILADYFCYGAENLLSALYEYALDTENETLVTNDMDDTDEDGTRVYSFSYSLYSTSLDADYNYTGTVQRYIYSENLDVYTVSFTLDENCTLTTLHVKVDNYQYSNSAATEAEARNHNDAECPIEHGEDGVTAKEVEHEYRELTVNQISKSSADYEAPEKPAILNQMIINEFDLWVLEEVDEAAYNAAAETATLKKYSSTTSGSDGDVTTYYLGTPVTDSTVIDASTAGPVMFIVDTKGKDDYISLNSFSVYYNDTDYTDFLNWGDFLATGISSNSVAVLRNSFSVRSRQLVGNVDIEVNLGAASKTVKLVFAAGAPESLNPMFSQYNQYTDSYSWNGTASTATVYAGKELQLKAEAVVTDNYALDSSFTAKVTSANAADAQLVWNEADGVYTFSAAAGTYEVTFTSTRSAQATGVLTVNVSAAPEIDELLAGEYINATTTVKVAFADGTVSIVEDGVGTTTYSYTYANGEITLSDKNGASDYTIEINDVYSLVLVSGQTRHILVKGLEPQMVLSGTTWLTSYGGETYYIRFDSDTLLTAYNGSNSEQYNYELTETQSGKYSITFEATGEDSAGYCLVYPETSNGGSYVEFDGINITKFVLIGDYWFNAVTVTYEQVTPELFLTNTYWRATSGESTYIITFKADGKLEVYDPEYAEDVEYYDYALTEGEDGRYTVEFSDTAGHEGQSSWCGIHAGEEGYLIWDADSCTVTSFVSYRYGDAYSFTKFM